MIFQPSFNVSYCPLMISEISEICRLLTLFLELRQPSLSLQPAFVLFSGELMLDVESFPEIVR